MLVVRLVKLVDFVVIGGGCSVGIIDCQTCRAFYFDAYVKGGVVPGKHTQLFEESCEGLRQSRRQIQFSRLLACLDIKVVLDGLSCLLQGGQDLRKLVQKLLLFLKLFRRHLLFTLRLL